MIDWFKKRAKRIDFWDIGLIKWSVAATVLFIIAIWPAAMAWVKLVNPWYFLIAAAVFGARPLYRFYFK